ncbi:MAG: phosphate signaling complex protein PhoU [Lentisphaeria bacterium]|nr:phosphate signaling complex protein PhoU [Lentisphaeria bacterium]
MAKIIHYELNRLERRLLRMAALVEESVLKAVRCCHDVDKDMADDVIASDIELDRQEVFIEEEALKVLALYQPVAGDLRFIVAVLKINGDLERIGDLAVTIAKSVKHMGEIPGVVLSESLDTIADHAVRLLRGSLDAFTKQDAASAKQLLAKAPELAAMHRGVINDVSQAFKDHPGSMETLISVLLVCRALERVADHAGNIAEDVVYMLQGTIIRHMDEREIERS